MTVANQIKKEIRHLASPNKREAYMRFFKTGKGEYGEGDTFLGLTVPETRTIAKRYLDANLKTLKNLLASPIHEVRFCALVILIHQFQNGDKEVRNSIYIFYLNNTDCVNNWDLVDVSAHKIVGAHLVNKSRRPLYTLATSKNLWERRISIIATFAFIDNGDFIDALALAEKLLFDSHDLIHKAVGWVLREVGKGDMAKLRTFLDIHAHEMPRTMLRYAIEKMDADERKHYMSF